VAQMRHEMGHVRERWHSCAHFPFLSKRRVNDVCNRGIHESGRIGSDIILLFQTMVGKNYMQTRLDL
jgi:hypothetical protein